MDETGSFFPKENRNSSLGTDHKIGVPNLPQENVYADETPTEYRYRLLGLAKECIGATDKRIAQCMHTVAPMWSHVEVRRNPETNSAHFRGTYVCNRVWTCPCCSARISNTRREELSLALAGAKLKGFTAVLVTYTLRHNLSQRLEVLLDGLQASLSHFKGGRGYQDIKAEWGIVGSIRALETTYGANGWHPHIHELVFLDLPPEKVNVHGLKKWLADRWLFSLAKLGFDASYEHGIDVKTADSEIAAYITKYGREPKEKNWGVEHEIASSHSKRGRGDGLTPFQLLECYEFGNWQAKKLFQEFAAALDGKRQLVWTKGLRELLALPDEVEDEQLPLEETPETTTLIEISIDGWKVVCLHGLHARILALASAGAVAALRELFYRYKIRAIINDPDELPVVEAQIVELPGGPEINQQLTLLGVSKEVYR